MSSRVLRVAIWLLLLAALAGLAGYVLVAGPPEPLAAIIFTPTPTPTNTPTPTPTATPTPTSTPTPTPEPLSVSLEVDPEEPEQGDTLVVQISSNREVALEGLIGEQPLRFVELDGSYWALWGLTSWAEVGPRPLSVSAISTLGEAVEVTGTVTVTYGHFPTEIIDIPSDREYLLDPEIVRAEAERLAQIYEQFSLDKLWQGEFAYPLQAITVTSSYGAVRQYDTGPGRHAGVDLDGETGDPAFAPADGRVVLSELLQVRGNTVVLDHGLGVYSAYNHMSELMVTDGELVSKGQVIGRLGSTGLSTGTHLHWELRVGGIAVDPFRWTRRVMLP
jgi:murein DD-endopeptidase MepM/ murein hydrolase activator NlpD